MEGDRVRGNGRYVTKAEITESFSLLYEVGANAVRLSHYPHNTYTYELCDKYGIAVYAEIPFVNTYGGSGTYDNPDGAYIDENYDPDLDDWTESDSGGE